MNYNAQQREQLRKLQDKIIAVADRTGIDGDMRLSLDMPENATVNALRSFIFPGYERELESVLHTLTLY